MKLKIYGAKAVKPELRGVIRDIRPTWVAEELGIPYEQIVLDPAKGENKTPEYLALNPVGKFPTLVDGDFTLFESAAICEYLAEKHGALIPKHGTPEYFLCKQWNYFAVTNIEPQALRIFACDFFYEKNETTTAIRKLGTEGLARFLPFLNTYLGQQDFLLKSGFSISDVLLTTSLGYAKHSDILNSYPEIKKYLERNMQRPAHKIAWDKNGLARA